MYWSGNLILIVGWIVIWSQIPDGLFSLSGVIVLIGIVLVATGDWMIGVADER